MQAETSKKIEDVVNWRKSAAKLAKEITAAKKNKYTSFLENLDFRTNPAKVHKYIKIRGTTAPKSQDRLKRLLRDGS